MKAIYIITGLAIIALFAIALSSPVFWATWPDILFYAVILSISASVGWLVGTMTEKVKRQRIIRELKTRAWVGRIVKRTKERK